MTKKIILGLIFLANMANAAVITIYNEHETGDFYVSVYKDKEEFWVGRLDHGKKIRLNTRGLSSFSYMSWREIPAHGNIKFDKKYPEYYLDIRSPITMLTGSVNLYKDGHFAKNFTPKNVGIRKIREHGVYSGKKELEIR